MYLHEFLGELEVGELKAEVVAGGTGQDEAKVNVDQVAIRVQQDVAVMSAEGEG